MKGRPASVQSVTFRPQGPTAARECAGYPLSPFSGMSHSPPVCGVPHSFHWGQPLLELWMWKGPAEALAGYVGLIQGSSWEGEATEGAFQLLQLPPKHCPPSPQSAYPLGRASVHRCQQASGRAQNAYNGQNPASIQCRRSSSRLQKLLLGGAEGVRGLVYPLQALVFEHDMARPCNGGPRPLLWSLGPEMVGCGNGPLKLRGQRALRSPKKKRVFGP